MLATSAVVHRLEGNIVYFFLGLLDGLICRIGLAVLLGLVFEWGIKGFWYGNTLAGYVPFLIGFIFFLSKKWMARPKAVRKVI